MYITIIGCSGVGYHLAKALLAAGHEVLVIEKSRSRCQLLYDELGSVVLCGDGTDQRVLKSAGVSRADILAAVTGVDETNLVACQIAKETFQVPRTMAVVTDTKNESVFHFLGVDVVVNATHLAVTGLEVGVPGRPMIHLLDLKAPDTELVSVSIPEDAAVVGKRLGEIQLPPHSFVSLVVKRNQAGLAASNLVLEGLDEVVAVTVAYEEQSLYDALTGV